MVDFQYTINVHAIFLYTMTNYGEDCVMEDSVDSNNEAHLRASTSFVVSDGRDKDERKDGNELVGYPLHLFCEQHRQQLIKVADKQEAELEALRAKVAELESVNQGLTAQLNASYQEVSVLRIDNVRLSNGCSLEMREEYLQRAEAAEEEAKELKAKVAALEQQLAFKENLVEFAHCNGLALQDLKDRLSRYEEIARQYLHSGGPCALLALDPSSSSSELTMTWKARYRQNIDDVIRTRDKNLQLREHLSKQDVQMQELELLVSDKDEEIADLKSQLSGKRRRVSNLRAKVARAYASKRRVVSVFEASGEADQKEIKSLRTRVEFRDKQIRELKRDAKQQEKKLEDAQQAVEAAAAAESL